MRVIAGSARGRRLQPVPGDGTRPITDRAKEALFSILAREVPGAWVLDLFAGTGGVGIEALSRGAEGCDFVDLAPEAIRTIQANLSATGLAGEDARVMRRDAFQLLSRPPEMPYHLIYVAPPQYKGLWLRALLALDAEPGWLAEDGVIVTQIHPREEQPVALEHFEERDRRDYGSVRLIFYRPRPDSVAPDGDAAVREADGVPDGQAAPRPQAPRR
ncbi:MAG: 16S rRNA (guanine(966)-N(2))-methyltransferase RsmD [Caldilineae bacterium]|nr:16S rRNA (guanine(966)-N(2))-methyltransferase RsmD [Chloroflexota bacterium]MCB9176444.1 16S rRNA (guanine(966)-N(2))-methyltransferase RsmD [Caldilineae bacterium]